MKNNRIIGERIWGPCLGVAYVISDSFCRPQLSPMAVPVRDLVRSLRQHPFTSSQRCGSEVRMGSAGFLFRVLLGQHQGVGRSGLPLRSGGRESAPRLCSSPAEFRAVLGRSSLVVCWLSARGCFRLLKATRRSFRAAPFVSVEQNLFGIKSPLCFGSL